MLWALRIEESSEELQELLSRVEEQHKVEIGLWRQKNSELLEKLKTKALQATLQGELVGELVKKEATGHRRRSTFRRFIMIYKNCGNICIYYIGVMGKDIEIIRDLHY